MSSEIRELYEERLGRYQAAMALKTADRVPIAPQSNYFAESYAGFDKQEVLYEGEKCLQAELTFSRAFPGFDALRSSSRWAPIYDAVGYKLFKLPGRDLAPNVEFQYVEDQYMKADEYRILIDDPIGFMMDRFLPRVLGEFSERGSTRSYLAFLKGGMAYVQQGELMKRRALELETKAGMPVPMMGKTLAPFDLIADGLRGLQGMILDVYRKPQEVFEACDSLVDNAVSFGLAGADPLKRYPIFIPTHKACFLTPEQFETLYWPSFKKTLMALIEAGYMVRPHLEGKWESHWHHLLELPKGSLVCDIDNENDIFKAKAELGHHHCIAGGLHGATLILGSPDEVRERVKLLCETVGKDGGYIINGSGVPYTSKVENVHAMVDAVMEYGVYDRSIKPKPRAGVAGNALVASNPFSAELVTPWEVKRAELGGILGNEELLREPWERLEQMAYNWLWMWAQC